MIPHDDNAIEIAIVIVDILTVASPQYSHFTICCSFLLCISIIEPQTRHFVMDCCSSSLKLIFVLKLMVANF